MGVGDQPLLQRRPEFTGYAGLGERLADIRDRGDPRYVGSLFGG